MADNNKNAAGTEVFHVPHISPAVLKKNARESLKLAVDQFKGRVLLSCRVWYQPSDGGDLKPGRDGWAMHIEALPDIIAELQRIETEARAAGILGNAEVHT